MAMTVCRAAVLALAVLTLSFLPALALDQDCTYVVYVRTGTIWKASTDSTISLNFTDVDGNSLFITNLTLWGGNLQGQDRDYFEGGALDIFAGLGDCLVTTICGMNLISDGTGDHHGWYVNYVEVTMTGAHLTCLQHEFEVERWLATDMYPWSLTFETNVCQNYQSKKTIKERGSHQSAS
ncbi:unnamed protein product [Calypogeia fissa]